MLFVCLRVLILLKIKYAFLLKNMYLENLTCINRYTGTYIHEFKNLWLRFLASHLKLNQS